MICIVSPHFGCCGATAICALKCPIARTAAIAILFISHASVDRRRFCHFVEAIPDLPDRAGGPGGPPHDARRAGPTLCLREEAASGPRQTWAPSDRDSPDARQARPRRLRNSPRLPAR